MKKLFEKLLYIPAYIMYLCVVMGFIAVWKMDEITRRWEK